MRRRVGVAGMALCLIASALAGARAANPGPPPGSIQTTPGSGKVAPRLTAQLNFALGSRVDASWDSWNDLTHLYDEQYVFPTARSLTLDACGSIGPIARYAWRLIPLDVHGHPLTRATTSCKTAVSLVGNRRDREIGRYRIELTVSTADGYHQTISRTAAFRDLLVVSIGDSLSSGEGNPDKDAVWGYEPGSSSPVITQPAVWKSTPCHRSAKSWSTLLARGLENRTTTVTFLNYACSGAETRHLITDTYRGIEAGPELPPQLEAVRSTLGAPTSSTTPQIDALLISDGINDLGFSDLLEACGWSFLPTNGDCTQSDAAHAVQRGIKELPDHYQELESAIGTHVKAAGIYVLEYMSRLFTDSQDRHGGCGAFEAGMRSSEAHWITDRGDELNAALASAARRNGWVYISGIRELFRHHGYCADGNSDRDRTWIRSYSGSMKLLGNQDGTAHPLGLGHEKIAEAAQPFIRLDLSPPARERVQIRLLSVRIDDDVDRSTCTSSDCYRVHFRIVGATDGWLTGPNGAELPIGRTVSLGDPGTAVDTYGASIQLWASLRIANRLGGPMLGVEISLPRSDGWQRGDHVMSASAAVGGASLRIEYRVTPILVRPGDELPGGGGVVQR